MAYDDLTPSNRFEMALSGDMTAEEASNRLEKILAGADIEPSNRLEYFLKLRVSEGGGGGGGGGGPEALVSYLLYTSDDVYGSGHPLTLEFPKVEKWLFVIFATTTVTPDPDSGSMLCAAKSHYNSVFGTTLRSDGTVGSDSYVGSYTPATGVLSISGQYAKLHPGTTYFIGLFDIGN